MGLVGMVEKEEGSDIGDGGVCNGTSHRAKERDTRTEGARRLEDCTCGQLGQSNVKAMLASE